MLSGPLIKYILTAARRDRLIMTLILMIIASSGLAVFLGSSSIVEGEQFSLVFGSGGLRILGVLGVILFVCFYMRRVFENKEAEFLLSRPVSRGVFLCSHAAAFIALSLFIAAAVTAPVFVIGVPSFSGAAVWGFSIGVEYAVMAVTALFFSMVLSSAAGSALATLGFYVLARMIGMLIGIAAMPAEKVIFAVLNKVMNVISILVPRLDLTGQTSWLVYGAEGSAGLAVDAGGGAYAQMLAQNLGIGGFIAAQGVLFMALLLAAAAFDFQRRQF